MRLLKSKKCVLVILATVCVFCLLSALCIFTCYFAPRRETVWVDDLYKRKEAYSNSIKGPKIVIVAGSSGLYGISAEQIEKHFNIPTVNFATHAALMDYYLFRAQKNLNNGDLVILAPEYHQYFAISPMSDIKADYIVNFDKPYAKSLPLAQKLSLIKTYAYPWKIIKNETLYFRAIYRNMIRTGGPDARNLNRNGDETSNIGSKEKQYKQVIIPNKFDPDRYVVKKISEFIEWCKRENIKVMLTWPGTIMNLSNKERSNIVIHSVVVLMSNAGAEIVGEPEDFFVPANYLYNTIYHLNSEGVAWRTSLLIDLLEKNQTFVRWKENKNGDSKMKPLEISPREMPDICYNGGMEQSSDNSISGWMAAAGDKNNPLGIAEWDNSCAHTGRYSLRLENTSGNHIRWRGEKISLPQKIRGIKVNAWSRARDINEKAVYCVSMKVYFKDGSFKLESRGLHFSKGTHDWEEVKSVIYFDKEAAAVTPYLILYSTEGTAWFDDISIRIHEKR
ncbi:MAG TPA: hypothetical protein PK874_06100 [Desulfobacteraceae bacterium]|nr:hypothetical protein [Desulfobacteraceae bacterium]HPJ68937.1 hypothetical protein [Desulfobacteraceae bacterium]HPQ27419.1 hypothetical protein [Desulfobacteraceae bacterium]